MLQQAVDAIAQRLPSFQVELRSGLFWHYLKRVGRKLEVGPERHAPCHPIHARRGRKLLYRVLYHGRKISVELSHIITDGAGGLEYLRGLLAEYFRIAGVEVADMGGIIRPSEPVPQHDFEDAYQRFHDGSIPPPPALEKAFQLPERLVSPTFLAVTTGISPLKTVLDLARESGASLTEYLAAHYLMALYQYLEHIPAQARRNLMRPIRLLIPVNVRKVFGAQTMRNFVLHVTPGIDPRLGEYSFEEALNQVHHFMRVELTEKHIKQQIARNMRGETLGIIRMTPLFLKIPFERMLYLKYGNAIASGILSNLGSVVMPPELEERIERFEFITVPNPDTKLSLGIVSYGANLYVTFGSLIRSRDIERRLFTALRKLGVPVKIETN